MVVSSYSGVWLTLLLLLLRHQLLLTPFCSGFAFAPPRLHHHPNRPPHAYSTKSSAIRRTRSTRVYASSSEASSDQETEQVVDVAIVGAGLGGLCAGAILNTLYNQTVAVYESHYLAGGCAHAFDRKSKDGLSFKFDSGPTILLGCSAPPFSALRQVLDAVGQQVDWIRYDGWGMIERPSSKQETRWKLELGPDQFQKGPLLDFGGPEAVAEFEALREASKQLTVAQVVPTLAMRPGPSALIPLLRYFPALVSILQQGEELTGTFAPYMDGPKFVVQNQWLRDWLDALAFSLSGLPANRTAAAAMAFVIDDLHRKGAALDYPKGGLGSCIDALVRGLEQGANGSQLHLSTEVQSIDFETTTDNNNKVPKATGVTLKNGTTIKARRGVICNAPVWSIPKLIADANILEQWNDGMPFAEKPAPASWKKTDEGVSIALNREESSNDQTKKTMLETCTSAEMTGSFLHLHVALDATGLDLDQLEAHYTVMDRGLSGDPSITVNGIPDGPCGELNMIAVSNPSKIDPTLAPEGTIIVHAYGAGNEPYELWDGLSRKDQAYQDLKEERSHVLWRAIESVIPDAKERVLLDMVGSPLTHERFLRRPRGTYGAATEDYLKDGTTPFSNLFLAGDSIFPGIGVPSVCISGASAANGLMNVFEQWKCLDRLKKDRIID